MALTIKHFPGGGARENGFDPHYAEGKFNVYPTPGSLATTTCRRSKPRSMPAPPA